ncbi:unnamed protein product [Clavelina lepadiformis]|uniref:Uncharacterized protein n=1 Tax=Clavelina lepadiformis TaxID=159417 RepID=A0ABP0F4L1_CLALP
MKVKTRTEQVDLWPSFSGWQTWTYSVTQYRDCGGMWPQATLSCKTGNCLRAAQNPVAARIRPAGRMLPTPGLKAVENTIYVDNCIYIE